MKRVPLFNARAARAARDEALEQVEQAADPDWKETAYETVVEVALDLPYFTTDQVMKRLMEANVMTHDLRALGPVMLRAARDLVIVKSDYLPRSSVRRSRHAGPCTVWRSLLYGGAA